MYPVSALRVGQGVRPNVACGAAGAPKAGYGPQSLRTGQEVLEPQPLPHLERHAMARRVAAERRLGRRVHAPLRGVAVLLGGGIEIGAAGVGDDRDVAVGLTARGERPRDLAVVEDVDVLVDDDDPLPVRLRAEAGE